jgi:YspA, cpYpsA-related SLOG family
LRILVCGGRDYSDRPAVFRVLDRLHKKHTITAIIQGGTTGADRWAIDWASSGGVVIVWFIADWKRLGDAAGPIRNQRQIDEGKPDAVVAFPGNEGIADTLCRAEAAGIPVGIQSRNSPMADTDTKTTDLDAKTLLSPPMMPGTLGAGGSGGPPKLGSQRGRQLPKPGSQHAADHNIAYKPANASRGKAVRAPQSRIAVSVDQSINACPADTELASYGSRSELLVIVQSPDFGGID